MAVSKVDAANQIENQLPQANIANNTRFRNLIINGDMSIAQRGTSFTSANNYTLDRFRFDKNNDGNVTITQDTDVPNGQGFVKSLKVDVTTTDTSLGTNQYAILSHRIEAQNLQYLKYGTANAETLTLSFWVKSNKTGTYCVSLIKIDNTRYDYIAEYSISSADTWEKKTITIAPDSNIKAAGGAIDNDNGIGLFCQFTLANASDRQGSNETWNTSTPATSTSNQVNFLDDTDNDWYITGVQLEAGISESDFEFLPYDVNLQRCMRYYEKNTREIFGGRATGTTNIQWMSAKWTVEKRANPTIVFYGNGTSNSLRSSGGSTVTLNSPSVGTQKKGTDFINVSSGLSSGQFYQAGYTADSEL